MIERVSPAISLENTGFEKHHAKYRNQAIAVIKVMRACTEKMKRAGYKKDNSAVICYTAMINAVLGEHA